MVSFYRLYGRFVGTVHAVRYVRRLRRKLCTAFAGYRSFSVSSKA